MTPSIKKCSKSASVYRVGAKIKIEFKCKVPSVLKIRKNITKKSCLKTNNMSKYKVTLHLRRKFQKKRPNAYISLKLTAQKYI